MSFSICFQTLHLSINRYKSQKFWGRHLWARGYFVATSGNVTDEVVAKYIELQGELPEDDESFRVSE